MNLSFSASNDGKSKWNKDGDKTITMHPEKEGLDLNKLGYFHLRPDTELMIRGKSEILKCSGSIDDITLSTRITIIFLISSKVDLNVLYELCRGPEPWEVRISDAQEQLSSYEATVAQYIRNSKKENIVRNLLDAGVDAQSLTDVADQLVEKFGQDGAKEIVKLVREAKGMDLGPENVPLQKKLETSEEGEEK